MLPTIQIQSAWASQMMASSCHVSQVGKLRTGEEWELAEVVSQLRDKFPGGQRGLSAPSQKAQTQATGGPREPPLAPSAHAGSGCRAQLLLLGRQQEEVTFREGKRGGRSQD